MSIKSRNVHTKNSDELKEEVEEAIAKAEMDFEAIEQRMTPGYFIDQAIFANRDMHPRASLDAIKENPLGSTFLTLGALMLASQKGGRTGEDILHDAASSARGQMQDRFSHGNVTSIKEDLSTKASQARNRIAEVKGQAADAKKRLQQKTQEFLKLEEVSPLMIASLGFGLGAAVGTALPQHQKEQDVTQHYDKELSQIKLNVQETSALALEQMKDALAAELKAMHFS